jgi:hypothetical protein
MKVCDTITCNLRRLITPAEFVRMLNEMRFGKLTPTSIETFKSLSRPLKFDDGIVPTELYVEISIVHIRH